MEFHECSVEDLRQLILGGINGHPSLETIRLKSCTRDSVNSHDILRALFSCNNINTCTVLDLSGNDIETMGHTHLPDFLATNPPLRELDLAENQFNDDDVVLIASALKQNTNLRLLSLDSNNIHASGRNALGSVTFDCLDLNTAANSNHTCSIVGVDIHSGFYAEDNPCNGSEDPSINRAGKLYSILSARNRDGTNVDHLNSEFGGDYSKFVPLVLDSVDCYSRKSIAVWGRAEAPLSITYEVLRNWVMPELFG